MNTSKVVNGIITALEDFDHFDPEATTVLVNKNDYSDIEVLNTGVEAFTEAHATCARFFYDDEQKRIVVREVREWVQSFAMDDEGMPLA